MSGRSDDVQIAMSIFYSNLAIERALFGDRIEAARLIEISNRILRDVDNGNAGEAIDRASKDEVRHQQQLENMVTEGGPSSE